MVVSGEPPKHGHHSYDTAVVTGAMIPPPPEPGQLVFVRQRRYLVEETVAPPVPGDTTLVRMACVDDDAQGQALEVLWESEVDAMVLSAEAWDGLASKGFDPPDHFAAYVHTLRWNSVTATDSRLFQAPFRAGIRLDAYQLEPLRKALLLPRVNLFIADDVGLGKTIEAGLIARELLLRRRVRDIVVACPPSMLLQWQEEMERRFGLTFEILDRAYITRVRQERGYAVNPWTTHPRFLVSHNLLIDEVYASGLRDHLGGLRPGSLLILDEAHHAAPASGMKYAIDSKITRAVRDLAPRFEHRLFLSATPHNGHSNSFSALLELLDPQRFCRGVPVRGYAQLEPVMVRRLKEDIRELEGGFPKRIPTQIDVDVPDDAPELVLSDLLDRYRTVRERQLQGASKRAQAASGLLIVGLQERLLSSVEAFARTLRVHRRTVQRQREAAAAGAIKVAIARTDMLGGGLSNDDDRADLSEEQVAIELDAQIEAATLVSFAYDPGKGETAPAQAEALLDQMTEVAEAARGMPDGKIRELLAWVANNACPGLGAGKGSAEWTDVRLIIFTEYEDTLRYIRQQLEAAIAGTAQADARIAIFHGPTTADKRQDIQRAFNTDPSAEPLRILVATDAAREGLNLQSQCWNLFHFDVPWNPARMEQRNGRIDRKLQPKPEVYCHYFVYPKRPEDRVLQVLVQKTERIRSELGSLSAVVESRLEKMISGGIRHNDVDSLVRQVQAADIEAEKREEVEAELEQTRQRQADLRKQIDLLRDRLERSQDRIGFDREQFQASLQASLAILGAPAMAASETASGLGAKPGSLAFDFPAIDRGAGGDSTWAETIDSLRTPRRRGQKLWEWRQEAPVLPVVFEDPGVIDDTVVQLHLEHRLVRRLLGRFTAQGFVYHDLSRACLAQTSDAIPRVVLLGRLALYGRGGVRLHEEIVSVSARWLDPDDRRGALVPYRQGAEDKTLGLLERAMLEPGGPVSDTVQGRLLAAVARDVTDLQPHLQERAEALALRARKDLDSRAAKEASDMRAILEDQQRRVASTYEGSRQMRLPIEEEAKQLEANRRHWERRLVSLEAELRSEPERIRHTYDVTTERVEPLGVAYLWPVTG